MQRKHPEFAETKNHYKSELLESHLENWRNKALYAQNIKETEDKMDKARNWQRPQTGMIKKQTKGITFADQ